MNSPADPQLSNREIFLAAAEMTDPEERRSYLDQACGSDAERRVRIERLLAARGSEATNPLDQAVAWLDPSETAMIDQGDASLEFDISLHPTIDRYKLLEQIGEGGMGLVFMAQQTEPVRRRVALKLIKPGMDSREVIARFEAERQALAMMDHPHIAHVLDAGTTPQGLPYFVMELVPGVPITNYCDDHQLSIAERLKLLIDICHAVQHAHQKGIIHRDLKPSNLLVTRHDGVPVVKVIDFGVAKALDQELTDRTLFTRFSQLVGTPLYMSPEQAEMSGLDIDTRSDIYSLGVLLYELLTGTTPFDKKTFSGVGQERIRRIIREQEPIRPSQQVSTLTAERLTTVANQRRIDGRQLSISMRRDLDWIAMKALEKDRNRRYESASAMAADLQRYLDDDPVEACPPSTLYLASKLARRYKGILGGAALIVLLLVVGIVVSSRFAIRASNAELAARTAQSDAEQTTEEMRNLLYASDMALASRAWRDNDIQQVRIRLARHIPQTGQSDLRGFEWHYLWKQQNIEGIEIADFGTPIYDLAISPDGRMFAATGADGMLHLFDLKSGTQKFSIAAGQEETNGVEFSPDSQRIAATGDDGTVAIWDLKTRERQWSELAHERGAYQVRFSPDGKIVATCGKEKQVRLWDAFSGESRGEFQFNEKEVETITMSRHGVIAAGDRDSAVALWELGPNTLVWSHLANEFDPVSSIQFSDRGQLAYGTLNGRLTMMDASNRAIASQRQFAEGIQSLAFAPADKGGWLAVGDRAGHLRIVPFEHGHWDLQSSRDWSAHTGRIYALGVTPDGKRILSGGIDGRLMAWDHFANVTDRIIPLEGKFNNIVSLADGQFAIGGIGELVIYNDDNQPFDPIDSWGNWEVAAASPARHLVARNVVYLVAWEIDSGMEIYRHGWENKGELVALAVSPLGDRGCVTIRYPERNCEIQIIDVATGKAVTKFPTDTAYSMAISPDGRHLAYDSNNDIHLYDLENLELKKTLHGHQASVHDLQFSPDGRHLASVSRDRTLKVWSLEQNESVYSVIAHKTAASQLAISPDGERIATIGEDQFLRLWDGENSEPLWEYTNIAGKIQNVCFSSDGQKLLCLVNDDQLLILDGSPAEE